MARSMLALVVLSLALGAGCSPPATSAQAAPSVSAAPASDAAPSTTRLALVTDFGNCDQGEADVASMVRGWNVEALLTAGDNTQGTVNCRPFEESVGAYFADFLKGPKGPRLFPVPGNHDYENTGAGEAAYQQYFSYLDDSADAGHRWYPTRFPHINLFMLDSELKPDDMIAQRRWTEQALRDARARSSSDWNVVVFHRPPYTSGPHEPFSAMSVESGWRFKDWGADLVVNGHQHVLEDVVVDGLHYLTAGVGAVDLQRKCPVIRTPGSQLCVEGFGAILITASPASLTLAYRVPSAGGERTANTLTLTRG